MRRLRHWPRGRRRWIIAGILAFVAVVALVIFESRRLDSLYWHDVGRDHRYGFSDAIAVPVSLTRSGFDLPPTVDPAHTILLRMEVSTTWLGRWLEPAVEVRGPSGSTSVQFLERGADGQRYLNIGRILDGPRERGGRVELRGRHLAWPEQQAELLLFAPPALDTGPVLVIAPHPDDAEIAAFGLYSATDAWIVTVSAGNHADRRLEHLVEDPSSRNRLVGELRSWDSVTVPIWGGVSSERAVNLGYFNRSLSRMYSNPTRSVADEILGSSDVSQFRQIGSSGMLEVVGASSSWKSLVDDLVAVIDHVRPTTIVAPHPLLDAAMDHRLTTVALIEALERAGPGQRSLLLYTNHHVTSEYFPFGPARGLVSLPPWTEQAIEARGVYSHAVDEGTRIRKLYALEAQHDLRPPPHYVNPGMFGRLFEELRRTIVGLWHDPADTYSYMRRAPRPNELFLVLYEEDLPELRSQTSELLEDLLDGGDPANAFGDYR